MLIPFHRFENPAAGVGVSLKNLVPTRDYFIGYEVTQDAVLYRYYGNQRLDFLKLPRNVKLRQSELLNGVTLLLH